MLDWVYGKGKAVGDLERRAHVETEKLPRYETGQTVVAVFLNLDRGEARQLNGLQLLGRVVPLGCRCKIHNARERCQLFTSHRSAARWTSSHGWASRDVLAEDRMTRVLCL